ncbi:MAG: hypothetical protein ACFFD7_09410 [Candidatus Thorarchaeota archaeon]
MSPEIMKELKYTFLAQLIVYLVFGIFFTFFVQQYVDLFSWPNYDPTAGRFIGVMFLSFAFVEFLAFRETDWEKVEMFVLLNMLISILGAIVQMVGVFVDGTGFAGWFNFAILIIFFVAFLYFYTQQQRQ